MAGDEKLSRRPPGEDNNLPPDIVRALEALELLLSKQPLGQEVVRILRDGVSRLADRRSDNMLILRQYEISKEKHLLNIIGLLALVFIVGVLIVAYKVAETNPSSTLQLLVGIFIGVLATLFKPILTLISNRKKDGP